MKRNIITAAVLSAMLLTGCGKETELIDQPETAGNAVSEQQSGGTESKIIKTEGETHYILGGETEAAVSESEAAETEIPQGIRLFDFGKLNAENEREAVSIQVKSCFLNGNILCALCGVSNENGHVRDIIRFYNIETETIEKTVRLVESYDFEEFLGGDENVLCKARLTHYINYGGVSSEEYSVITFKNDYTYDYSEYTPQNAALSRGGHNIAQWYIDIIDADRDMKIVEGVEADGDGYDPNTRSQRYMFPADENRFVYFSLGYESMPGFGIYDFETDTAADVPNSENLLPIGFHDGKAYSVKTAWDGFGTELYTTDTETLETEFFTDYPYELEHNAFVEYAMSEDGSKIAVLKSGNQAPQVLYIIDPDTTEIISEYEIDEPFHYNLGVYFADSDTVFLKNWQGKYPLMNDPFPNIFPPIDKPPLLGYNIKEQRQSILLLPAS